jgi:hypothetical protein
MLHKANSSMMSETKDNGDVTILRHTSLRRPSLVLRPGPSLPLVGIELNPGPPKKNPQRRRKTKPAEIILTNPSRVISRNLAQGTTQAQLTSQTPPLQMQTVRQTGIGRRDVTRLTPSRRRRARRSSNDEQRIARDAAEKLVLCQIDPYLNPAPRLGSHTSQPTQIYISTRRALVTTTTAGFCVAWCYPCQGGAVVNINAAPTYSQQLNHAGLLAQNWVETVDYDAHVNFYRPLALGIKWSYSANTSSVVPLVTAGSTMQYNAAAFESLQLQNLQTITNVTFAGGMDSMNGWVSPTVGGDSIRWVYDSTATRVNSFPIPFVMFQGLPTSANSFQLMVDFIFISEGAKSAVAEVSTLVEEEDQTDSAVNEDVLFNFMSKMKLFNTNPVKLGIARLGIGLADLLTAAPQVGSRAGGASSSSGVPFNKTDIPGKNAYQLGDSPWLVTGGIEYLDDLELNRTFRYPKDCGKYGSQELETYNHLEEDGRSNHLQWQIDNLSSLVKKSVLLP